VLCCCALDRGVHGTVSRRGQIQLALGYLPIGIALRLAQTLARPGDSLGQTNLFGQIRTSDH